MKIDIRLLLAAALAILVVAGVFAYRALTRTEEDAIRREFSRLMELAAIDGMESPLKAGLRAADIVEFFTTDINISSRFANISISSRRELRQLVFQARTSLERLSVRVRRNRIEIDADGENATMDISLEIRVVGMGENRRDRDSFTIQWVKRDGNWLIDRIERYETIRTISDQNSAMSL